MLLSHVFILILRALLRTHTHTLPRPPDAFNTPLAFGKACDPSLSLCQTH